MKKCITVIMCLICVSVYAETAQKGPASITSGEAGFYVETAQVSQVLERLNAYIGTYLDTQDQINIKKQRKDFESKTGIDFMNPASLDSAGVDIERNFAFAYFEQQNHKEKMLIFVPVKNEVTSPLKLVEIIRKMNEGNPKKKDLNPVMTSHEGYTIYQLQRDIFFSAVKGNLVIAPDGDAIKEVIDISAGKGSSLADSGDYLEYISKRKSAHDINMFLTKGFLNGIMQSFMQGMRGPVRGGSLPGDLSLIPVQYKQQPQNPALDSVNYVSGGVSFDAKRLLVSVGARLNETNPFVAMFLGMIKTGATSGALYSKDAESYSFLSFEPGFMESMCKKGGPGCAEYNKMKDEIKRETGIDLSKDFIPNFSGVISVVSARASAMGQMGDYVVFLPMKNAVKTSGLLKKARASIKKNLAGNPQAKKMFGDKYIARKKAFWISTDMRQKNYVVSDKRGIYIGNNDKLLAKALKFKQLGNVKNRNVISDKMNSSTFFLSFVKKESFITSMMKMQAAGNNRKMQKIAGSIGDICVSGMKNDSTVSVDLDLELLSK